MTFEHHPDLRAEAERIAAEIRARGGKIQFRHGVGGEISNSKTGQKKHLLFQA